MVGESGNRVTSWVAFVQFSSVTSDSLRPHESQLARSPCPSPTPRVYSDWRPSSRWSHPAISSSVVPFSSCPQSLPASESFPVSPLFAWGGQSTGVSALASFQCLSKREVISLRLVFFRWYLMVYTVTVLDLYDSKWFCMTTVLISFGTIETLNELSSWERILEILRCLPYHITPLKKWPKNSSLNTDHCSLYHVSLSLTYKFFRRETLRSREIITYYYIASIFFKCIKSDVKSIF